MEGSSCVGQSVICGADGKCRCPHLTLDIPEAEIDDRFLRRVPAHEFAIDVARWGLLYSGSHLGPPSAMGGPGPSTIFDFRMTEVTPMAIPLYDLSVASFLQVLGAVSGFLDKGARHCQAAGIDPNDLVEMRLCPDMLPFRFQIMSVAHHSRGAIDGVQSGVFMPPSGVAKQDYAALQKIIDDARTTLQALSPETVAAMQGRELVFRLGERDIPFVAEDFLMSFSLPNLYFHATTAYDILRIQGVPLGKRDYLGQLRIRS
jgi:hypothetical protein